MKAELGIYPKDRQVLYKILPLDTPLVVDLYVSNICNFKCNYCLQSSPKEIYDASGLKKEFMGWDTFELALKQLREFPRKIKQIALLGIGEPTLHNRLPDMIRAIRNADIAETVMVITNGSQLNPEYNQELVNAGLQVLRISLQGLSAEKYMEISHAKIDWDLFYANIVNFSEIKGTCKLKVKIADTALTPGDEERFYQLFGNICDAVAIEHIYDAFSSRGKEYSNVSLVQTEKTKFGLDVRNIDVCWIPFIRINLRPDGVTEHCGNACFGLDRKSVV